MRVSVVIPSYNAEGFLDEALRSVLEQTRAADEIVVVDDASSDRTVEIAQTFSPRVRVMVNSTNAGPGVRRNQGAHDTNGDVLAFLDADDRWDAHHLEEMIELLDRYPDAGFAFSRVRLMGARSGVWPESTMCSDQPRYLVMDLLRGNRIHCSSALVRRAAFEGIGGFDESARFYRGRRVQAEDYDFFLRLSRKWRSVGSENPTADYRWHPGQSSVAPVPQAIRASEYRLKLLDRMRDERASNTDVGLAKDRIRLCWEELLEGTWSGRRMVDLRMAVLFGLRHGLLVRPTWRYILRATLPMSFVRRNELSLRKQSSL